MKGSRRHHDQVGGQGEVVEKGEIGMMALAADGGEGGRLIQAQTGAEQRDHGGGQPTAVDRCYPLPVVASVDGRQPDRQVVVEGTVAPWVGEWRRREGCGLVKRQVGAQPRHQLRRDEIMLDEAGGRLGGIAIEEAQIPEGFGGRDRGAPRLVSPSRVSFAPRAVGADEAKAVLEGVDGERASGGQ